MASKRRIRQGIIVVNCVAPFVMLGLFIAGHPWWALAVIVFAHALWLLPTLLPACDWCGPVVCKLPPTGEKEVWLTIDDGPDEHDTPLLLDLLDAHGAKATFFFIGAKAARHPGLVREVVSRGHEVGNHTMTHPQYSFWAYGPGAARREIMDCQRALHEACGVTPTWFRAPAGFKSPFVQAIVEREGLRLACWSARGLDGVDTYKTRVLERLKSGIAPGAIILMHEGRLDLEGKRLAPQVLGGLLTWLQANGYRCVLPEQA